MSTKIPKTWSQLKTVVEYSRKFIYAINNNVPSNVNFREYLNPETGLKEYRIYFLASTQKHDVTIKYVTVTLDSLHDDKLIGSNIFQATNAPKIENKKLTKEEQLLRERKRCAFTGITQYSIDSNGRFVFSEQSDLFSFDDEIPMTKTDNHPIEITTHAAGAIDVQICPFNSNLISYVLDDNLWIQNLTTKQEIKLTNTSDTLKSGVPSYAVQEEFDRYSGYWWYPNKQINSDKSITYRIVYEETDEDLVDLVYITPSCTGDDGYDTYRYPRAGTPNSKVFLKMVEFTVPDNTSEPLVIHKKKMPQDFYELFNWFEYLTRGSFTPDGKHFWVQIYDRIQLRTADLLVPLDYFIPENSQHVEMEKNVQVKLLSEKTSSTWINSHNSMHFMKNSNNESISYISANDDTGFLHLYHHKISMNEDNFNQVSNGVVNANKVERTQITTGEWCVDASETITVDEQNNLVYFHAYIDPLECQLCVANYSSQQMKQLTSSGSSHHVTINQETNLFVSISSNLNTPYQAFIYKIQNQDQGLDNLKVTKLSQITSRKETDANGQVSADLNFSSMLLNNALRLNMETFLMGQNATESSIVSTMFKPPEIFNFMTPDNCKLYGMIYKPFNYVEGEKYPTLLYVYGGPHVQLVTNTYKVNKFSRLNVLSLLGYCVVVIDSRGSNNRGLAFEAYLKHCMGTVEIADQVHGIEAAAKMYNCIDMKRIGIFGWSYGGYMSLMGLAQRPDIFKVAVSGAPVTSWNLYDTAYTERYMGLPDVNEEAYANGSVIKLVKQFPDEENRLLIIHGMIDENVHFAHTRQFIDALINEGKPYNLQIYPNERHGIRSRNASIHCDLNLFSYLEKNL